MYTSGTTGNPKGVMQTHRNICVMMHGQELVMMRRWNAKKDLEHIQSEKVVRFVGVPTMVTDMMEHPEFSNFDTSSLSVIVCGGGPTPKSEVGRTKDAFPSVGGTGTGQGCGLTETNGGVCANVGNDYVAHPTSTGMPSPWVEPEIRRDS